MASPSNHEQEVDQDQDYKSYTEREVDQELWEACAGVHIHIPKLDSLVYYFPRDHIEHSSSSPNEYILLSRHYGSRLCRVTNVSFHADSQTDQVFVKFLLQPCKTDGPKKPAPIPSPSPNPIRRNRINDNIVTYVKVLSKSDIQEGLLVTKALHDCIFSKLPQNPGREIFQLIDIHGKIWEIMVLLIEGMFDRFTYGWHDFAETKNLKEGDSIVFMLKKSTNKCHVGIRTANINRSISIKDVTDAIEKVENKKSFEVVYYPIWGLPEFVVPKEKVDNASHVSWTREKMVMIPYEFLAGGHEPIKCWLHGKILDYVNRENDDMSDWPDCWWRVLEIIWYVSPEIILEKMPNLLNDSSPWELQD
ncbi:unnamed protein product [Amaranthus hypochondriacus]